MSQALSRATRLLADPPLDPTPDEARSGLRRELLKPEYHQEDVLQRVLTWVERQVLRALDAAADAPPLSTLAAIVVFAGLLLLLGWLVSRTRRTPQAPTRGGAVLTDEPVTAAELRARAGAALAAGRHEDAVVDGFRALALRQVERGRLDDAPGTTAREVAAALAAEHPHLRPRVEDAASLFDLVLYGERSARRDRAEAVLALDDELAGVR